MADVFVSYASADRDIAKALAEQIQADGRSVWWDVETAPGASFREEIAKQLNAAKSVIVIWTPASVKSQWVISEAQRAAAQNKLIPVRTPDVDVHSIPQPFDVLHTPIVSDNVIAAIKVRPRSMSWLSTRYFIGMVLRLSIVVAVISGAVDASKRWNEYTADQSDHYRRGTAYECAAKLPRETVVQSLNSFGNFDAAKFGCSGGQTSFWISVMEFDQIRRGEDIRGKPWRVPFDLGATAAVGLIAFVLSTMAGVLLFGAINLTRWILGIGRTG